MGRKKGSKNKQAINPKKITSKDISEVEEMRLQEDPCPDVIKAPEEKKELTKEQKERKERLDATLRGINKIIPDAVKYANTIEVRERLPFKHKCLNDKTGGGIPRGTYTTIWGGKGVGKSTEVLDLIAETQKKNLQCVYINGERSYDPIWAKQRGVNTETLVVVDVENLEQGLDIIIKLTREKAADLIILDSIHGLAPKGELYEGKKDQIEKSVVQDTMALRARKMTQFFEMATSYVAEAKCAVVLLAQSRMNLDLGSFIKLEHLTGGHALMHFSRMILRFRRGQGADAPTEKRPTGRVTEKGKDEMESVKIGFDLVVHVDKSQVPGCTEGDELHVPFFYKDGIHE
jgi:recombination protein RecA